MLMKTFLLCVVLTVAEKRSNEPTHLFVTCVKSIITFYKVTIRLTRHTKVIIEVKLIHVSVYFTEKCKRSTKCTKHYQEFENRKLDWTGLDWTGLDWSHWTGLKEMRTFQAQQHSPSHFDL